MTIAASSPHATAPAEAPLALWAPFDEATRPGSDVAMRVWDSDGFAPVTWDEWRAGALRAGAALRELGVERGSPVACLLTNSGATIRALTGAWAAGATALSMPIPARGMSPEHYQQKLRAVCAGARPTVFLAEQQFCGLLEAAFGDDGPPIRAFESLDAAPLDAPEPPVGGETAFVQFSSGSTGDPRGCTLSASAIDVQLALLAEAVALTPDDTIVSWLPLSHDMGLFGALLECWYRGADLVIGPPQRFLAAPRSWLQDCADAQATMTVAPNFALALAARSARVAGPSRSFPLRGCVLGGERIWWHTLSAADAALAAHGMGLDKMMPAYGMAEATLAVTVRSVDDVPRKLTVDRKALLGGELVECGDADPDGTEIVSCGRPLRGTSVRTGGRVGQIRISSPSLAGGYLGDPEATATSFRDGDFVTQDLGFVVDGELYVVGRVDDVLCVGGRNVYAGEIEAAMGADIGVRPGSSVLVDLDADDGQQGTIVLVAEPRKGVDDLRSVARAARRLALELAGLRLDEVVFVVQGTLPKTPSGKVQRHRCRELVREDSPSVLARVG